MSYVILEVVLLAVERSLMPHQRKKPPPDTVENLKGRIRALQETARRNGSIEDDVEKQLRRMELRLSPLRRKLRALLRERRATRKTEPQSQEIQRVSEAEVSGLLEELADL